MIILLEVSVDIYEYIGGQIRALREECRLSQEALAKEIRVSTNTISRWETATYKLSIEDLQKIADYFKVKLSALLPPEQIEAGPIQKALLSATGSLPNEDIEALIEYAEFRRARRRLKAAKDTKD
jgi:transcriptional regulator with XRE-family HTH domain